MAFQQLQQRLASCSQASCSYAARPAAFRSQQTSSTNGSRHTKLNLQQYRSRQACRAADGDDDSTAAAQIALDPRNDTVYDRMTFATNITPDYEDPQWVERVDDWEEFWYSTEDEELDADEDLSPAERSEQSLERARKCSRPAPGFTTLCPPFMTLLRTSRQATGAARQNSSI